jgi:hypothetical protein
MKFRGGEFSTGTTGNFQSELTVSAASRHQTQKGCTCREWAALGCG